MLSKPWRKFKIFSRKMEIIFVKTRSLAFIQDLDRILSKVRCFQDLLRAYKIL